MLRYRILINPTARNGADRRWVGIVREAFAKTDHEVVIPGSFDAMRRAAREAIDERVDVVVVVGGDGTVNAVANVLAGSETALAVVPAGTANDLARALNIPLNPRGSCQSILTGQRLPRDLGRVNGQYFLTGGGTGIVSDVALGVHALKSGGGLQGWLTRALGSLAYSLYSAWLLLTADQVPHRLHLVVDGHDLGDRNVLAFFVQNQPAIGRTIMPCPDTRPTDGSLGYCRLSWHSRLRGLMLAALLNQNGAHRRHRDVLIGEGRQFVLTSDEPLDFMADGEPLSQSSQLCVEVVPAGVWVIAPGPTAARQDLLTEAAVKWA
ncbi:MAG: YegS/Rv2252/BmrU family lipid kinase [Candidatus Sericytochromatia bacterium]|nr:YegS/Rv2252/BmrU family lipid kinase [Candidatus Sericytochromatia bacterium]